MLESGISIPRKGIMLLICGPAGSGKTTLCDRLLGEFDNLTRIITATTRQPREGEVHGVDYFFLTSEDFDKKISEDAFYEHALVHGRNYGTLKSEVVGTLKSGRDILINIDVQGSASFREKAKTDEFLASKLITIFIRPESMDVIRERLRGRGSDDESEIERRIVSAENEMKMAMEHHYVLPTSSRDEDYRLISSIYLSEKHRVISE